MFTIYDLRDIIQTAFWGGMLVLILIGWGILKANQARMRFYVAWLIIVPAGFLALILPSPKEYREAKERQQRYETGKAIFAERCKNAGEKIYKTVDNVEGVMLLKVRINQSSRDAVTRNPMWENAAVAHDFENMGYIASFLNNHSRVFSDTKKTYHYVDVLQTDQSIIRYEGLWSYTDKPFKQTLNPKNPVRYAVTFEDDINPKDRKYWIAGTTIKIIDLQTNEILGERKTYAFEHGQGSLANARMPWLRAEQCPNIPIHERYTFLFVHKVLKPKWDTQ